MLFCNRFLRVWKIFHYRFWEGRCQECYSKAFQNHVKLHLSQALLWPFWQPPVWRVLGVFVEIHIKLYRRSILGSPDGIINLNKSINIDDDTDDDVIGHIQGTYHVYDAIYFFFELYLEELGELVPHRDLTHHRMYLHEIPFFMVKFYGFWNLIFEKKNFLGFGPFLYPGPGSICRLGSFWNISGLNELIKNNLSRIRLGLIPRWDWPWKRK